LPLDPIEFRRRNALKTREDFDRKTVQRLDPHAGDSGQAREPPDLAATRPEKARASRAGSFVGTGVACVTKPYGSGADCSQSAVEIDPQGRIAIHGDHVDMGTGLGRRLQPGGDLPGRRGR